MRKKFANLLEKKHHWRIVFNNTEYTPLSMAMIVFANVERWKQQGIELTRGGYILGVGDNSFHHLVYIFLASAFNLKLILIGHKQLEYFENPSCYIPIQYILSPREISGVSKQTLLINLDVAMLQNCDDLFYDFLSRNKAGQAELAFCTSGTTSDFKIARYCEHKLYENAKVVGNYMGLSIHDKCLCMFPLAYMYGFSVTMSTIIKGGTVILESAMLAPALIIEYLINDAITLLPILGRVIDSLMPHVPENLFFPNLKVINAADKIYVSHVKKIFKIAPIFWNNMGQTESGPRLFSLKITKDEEAVLGQYSYNNVIALGHPVDNNIKVDIRKENGSTYKDEEVGELFYKTKFGMEGYLNVENPYKDGWRSSGDLVCRGKNGIFYWIGRKNQLIKINGTFVNTNLLHVVFDKLPFIKASFCMPCEENNNIYGFFSIDRTMVENNERAIQLIAEYYAKIFPLYPRIAKYVFIQALPKTETGKVNLKKLRSLAKRF